MNTERTARAGLPSDERGAVLLMGVFMCACMVGMLWYVAGIGDAIFFRERIQEASDASAFSAAVLHARGMNLIVLLNLIMAAILSLRVALRALQAGLYVASIVLALLPIPGAAGAATITLRGADAADRAVRASRPAMDATLKAMSTAQKGIAIAVPGAAIAGSYQVGTKYKPMVTLSAAGNPFELRGLPVVEGTTDKLCNEAGRTAVEVAEWIMPLPIPDFFLDRAKSVIGKTVEEGKIYFCGFGKGQPPNLDQHVDEEVGKQCKAEQDDLGSRAANAESAYAAACRRAGAGCDSAAPEHAKLSQAERDELKRLQVERNSARSKSTSFDAKSCREQKKAEAEERMKRANEVAADPYAKDKNAAGADDTSKDPKKPGANGKAPGAKPAGKSSTEGMTPKMVASEFKNGVNRAQMLAITVGDDSLLSISPVGVKSGAWNMDEKITIPRGAQFAVAQAEYFFDCKGVWTAKSCNDAKGGGEEAMWHLRWRARMRRYNAPFTRSSNALMQRLSEAIVQMQYAGELMRLTQPKNLANVDAVQAIRGLATDPIIH